MERRKKLKTKKRLSFTNLMEVFMLNVIPIIGWIMSLVFSISIAIPFWICYTVCGLGQKYFYWLPEVYQAIPFWNCVGLFIVISILKGMLVPKFSSVENKNESK